MGAKYAATGTQAALSTTAETVLGYNSLTARLRRMRVYFFSVGFSGAPADIEIDIILQRYTADGTNTSVTPIPLDPADEAGTAATAGENHSVEPTYTAGALLLELPVHQKNTILWYAPPGGELVIPATNEAGIGIQGDASSGTPACTATMHVEE